jgi:lysozyme
MKRAAREIASTGQHGVDLIKGFETFHKPFENATKAEAYKCPAGIWTIGWGHTGADTHEGVVMSRQDCERLLSEDLKWAEEIVRREITAPITQNQFDALVAFVFNCGPDKFGNSTLKQRVNAEATPGDITEAFLRFRKARVQGQLVEVAGLVRRRAAEAKLFNTPDEASVAIAGNGDVEAFNVTAPDPVKPLAPDEPAKPDAAPKPQAAPANASLDTQQMPQAPRAALPKPIAQSRTIWGAILALFSGAGAFLSVLWTRGEAILANLRQTLPFDPLWALAGLFGLGIAIVLYARMDDQAKASR